MPPPAGLRWTLWQGRIDGASQLIFRDSALTNSNLFSTVRWSAATGIANLPAMITERNAGQSITLSLIYWTENNAAALTGLPDDGTPRLRAQFGIPQIVAPAAGGATLGAPTRVETYVQGNPSVTDGSTATTVRRLFPFMNRNNSERAEVIMSATWDNLRLPAGVPESNVCVQPVPDATQVGRESGGVWSSLAPVAGQVCFLLKAPANVVQVESGDVLANSIARSGGGLSSLQFTSVNGQTVVNGQAWTRCDQFSSLPNACTPNTTVLPDATTTARLTKQFAAAATAAERVAIIGRSGLDATSFLMANQNAWLNPRGEVLYVNGSLTIPTNVNVVGKKLVIARGDISVQSVTGSTGAQAAIISLEGGINIRGTEFDGAAIATGVNGQINLAGDGQLVINGLLSARTITFVGRTAADNTIARLNYDARYQRGELLGLSAILRPLVTEPSF